MKNRGVIGTIMTTFVVGIIVIILAVGYLALTGTMKVVKPSGGFSVGERAEMNEILFENIDAYGNEMNVFDAFVNAEEIVKVQAGKLSGADEKSNVRMAAQNYRDSLAKSVGEVLKKKMARSREEFCFVMIREFNGDGVFVALKFSPDGSVASAIGENMDYSSAAGKIGDVYKKNMDFFIFSSFEQGKKSVSYKPVSYVSSPEEQARSILVYGGGCLQYEK